MSLWNRWWMLPCHVLTQFLAQVQQLEGLLLALQLPGWKLHRGNLKGFFALFLPEQKVRQSPRSRVRHCCRTPARPRHQLMAKAPGLRATYTRTLMATCGSEWTTASGRSSAPTSSGTSRGDGDPGGCSCCTSTVAWPSSVARGQGLGIPWPLLGCPCRPRASKTYWARGQGLGIP